MNQYNNFNSYNNQNGMSNNHDVNQNMNVIQPTFNQQAQTTLSAQQPTMHTLTPQSSNTYEGNNISKQSLYSKNPKKKNLLLIIEIVVFVVILTVVAFLIFKKDSTFEEEKNYTIYTKIYETDDNKFYYADNNENIKTFSGFKRMENTFHYNVAQGSDSNNNYFLIDINNNYVVKPGVYEKIFRIGDKFFSVYKNGKYGVIDCKGNELLSPQFTNIRYVNEGETGYFLASNYMDKNSKEYYLITEKGKIFITETDEIYTSDIIVYKKYTNQTFDSLIYKEEKVYDLNSGKLILETLDNGSFFYNVYYDYDEDIVVIYDKKLKIKEKRKINNFSGIQLIEDGILISADKKYLIDKNLEIVSYDEYNEKKLKEFIEKEGFTHIEDGFYHILANKTKVITKIDKENDRIIIYDVNGKYLAEHKVANGKRWNNVYTFGNYFAIEGNGLFVMDIKGETISGYANNTYIDEIYNGKENYIASTDYRGQSIILNDNFMLKFEDKVSAYYLENGVWILEKNIASFYDMNGKISKTIEGITKISRLIDNYLFFEIDNGSYKILDSKNNITLEINEEIPYNNIPYSYNNDEIGIIELSDGFYSLDGKKLITK